MRKFDTFYENFIASLKFKISFYFFFCSLAARFIYTIDFDLMKSVEVSPRFFLSSIAFYSLSSISSFSFLLLLSTFSISTKSRLLMTPLNLSMNLLRNSSFLARSCSASSYSLWIVAMSTKPDMDCFPYFPLNYCLAFLESLGFSKKDTLDLVWSRSSSWGFFSSGK